MRVFVKHGAKVMIADVEDAAGAMLAETLSPSATYVHCDPCSQPHHGFVVVDKQMELKKHPPYLIILLCCFHSFEIGFHIIIHFMYSIWMFHYYSGFVL